LLKSFLNILVRPFPAIETAKEKIVLSLSFGLFIFLFLAVFQPFGLDKTEENKLLYISGYGFITIIVMLFNFFITSSLFKAFFLPEKWSTWKFFIFNFVMIIPIAVLNWSYLLLVENVIAQESGPTLLEFLFHTTAVGFFPVVFLTFFLEQKLRARNIELSRRVNNQLEFNSPTNYELEELNFNSQNTPNIKLDNFVCVKSMGNYVTLFFMDENQLKKEVIRTTMKKIEEDFMENKKIIRCHKSYFVNLNKVVTTSGNARALYLHINELDFQIPVSRNFSKDIILGTI